MIIADAAKGISKGRSYESAGRNIFGFIFANEVLRHRSKVLKTNKKA